MDSPNPLQEIPCPLCGAFAYRLLYDVPDRMAFHLERAQQQPREKAFQIVACSSCGFLYLNPRPDRPSSGDSYRPDSYDPHRRQGGGMMGALFRCARRITVRWKAAKVSGDLAAGSLLDVGCGTGEFMTEMKRRGWRTRGIEISADAAGTARERGCEVIMGDAAEADLPAGAFDLVTLWHSLEHLPDLKGTADNLSKALKPGGRLAVAVPNPDSFDAGYYKERWAAWDAPRHLYHFRSKDLKALFSPYGIQMRSKTALPLDPFYHALLSELSWTTGMAAWLGAGRGAGIGMAGFAAGLKPERASSILYIFRKD